MLIALNLAAGRIRRVLGVTAGPQCRPVEDADKVYDQAVKAGAAATMPLEDQFWGDRYGKVKDPFGHTWAIATHIKDLSPEEMKKAQDEAMAKMPTHA